MASARKEIENAPFIHTNRKTGGPQKRPKDCGRKFPRIARIASAIRSLRQSPPRCGIIPLERRHHRRDRERNQNGVCGKETRKGASIPRPKKGTRRVQLPASRRRSVSRKRFRQRTRTTRARNQDESGIRPLRRPRHDARTRALNLASTQKEIGNEPTPSSTRVYPPHQERRKAAICASLSFVGNDRARRRAYNNPVLHGQTVGLDGPRPA